MRTHVSVGHSITQSSNYLHLYGGYRLPSFFTSDIMSLDRALNTSNADAWYTMYEINSNDYVYVENATSVQHVNAQGVGTPTREANKTVSDRDECVQWAL